MFGETKYELFIFDVKSINGKNSLLKIHAKENRKKKLLILCKLFLIIMIPNNYLTVYMPNKTLPSLTKKRQL